MPHNPPLHADEGLHGLASSAPRRLLCLVPPPRCPSRVSGKLLCRARSRAGCSLAVCGSCQRLSPASSLARQLPRLGSAPLHRRGCFRVVRCSGSRRARTGGSRGRSCHRRAHGRASRGCSAAVRAGAAQPITAGRRRAARWFARCATAHRYLRLSVVITARLSSFCWAASCARRIAPTLRPSAVTPAARRRCARVPASTASVTGASPDGSLLHRPPSLSSSALRFGARLVRGVAAQPSAAGRRRAVRSCLVRVSVPTLPPPTVVLRRG